MRRVPISRGQICTHPRACADQMRKCVMIHMVRTTNRPTCTHHQESSFLWCAWDGSWSVMSYVWIVYSSYRSFVPFLLRYGPVLEWCVCSVNLSWMSVVRHWSVLYIQVVTLARVSPTTDPYKPVVTNIDRSEQWNMLFVPMYSLQWYRLGNVYSISWGVRRCVRIARMGQNTP